MKRHLEAFTLIELLVVILIIAVLATLILSGVQAARRFADRTEAKTTVHALEAALTSYYSDYHRWPNVAPASPGAAIEVTGEIALMLQGEDLPAGNNPKRIRYMNFQRLDGNDPVSPWRRNGPTVPEHHYYFKVDHNFDNMITGSGFPANPPPAASPVRRTVITWVKNTDQNSYVTSWDE